MAEPLLTPPGPNRALSDDRLHRIVNALTVTGQFAPIGTDVELVETHISVVVLAGQHVYKFKKDVNLGFLDFSSLAKRRFYCEEELRLNRRFAPRFYLDVVPVSGTEMTPRLGGPGEAIEYCVKMLRFNRDCEFDKLLLRGRLHADHIEQLAHYVAAFHRSANLAPSRFGVPQKVSKPAFENLAALETELENDSEYVDRLRGLRIWAERMDRELHDAFLERQSGGFIRECHGDLHLGNIALHDTDIVIFDCIEFSESLRFIDVMSDVAFVTIDLNHLGHAELGNRFLNTYLEHTGDYAGASVLRFYQTYRALVRAKVAAIRLRQTNINSEAAATYRDACHSYIDLALTYTLPAAPALVITHGVSGSGKSTVCAPLAERIGAIRVRSDVERKRLHGLSAAASSRSGLDAGIYTASASEQTYTRLLKLAEVILRAGHSVIADATFLKRAQRAAFQSLAKRLDVPFSILTCEVDESELRRRVNARSKAGGDVSEANVDVLTHQLLTQEPLDQDEMGSALVVKQSATLTIEDLVARLAREVNR